MPYTVIIQPSAERAIDKLDRQLQRRVIAKLETLAHNPRGPDTRKLAGEDSLYRVRVGFVRIIYSVHDDRLIVLVLRVARRDEAYR